MESQKPLFRFIVDTLTPFLCTGWYARYDEKDTTFVLYINGKASSKYNPNQKRQDVADAGLGTPDCGFEVRFQHFLSPGDRVEFRSESNELLANAVLENASQTAPRVESSPASDSADEPEPFTANLLDHFNAEYVEKNITHYYARNLRAALKGKNGEELTEALVTTLAAIRTDLHSLKAACAALAEYGQAPQLPRPKPVVPPTEIMVDMRGDFTGGNWYYAEDDGRWAGPEKRSTVMVPALKPGDYLFEMEVKGEIVPDVIKTMEITINDLPVPFTRVSEGLPTFIQASFSVEEEYRFPFWIFHFDFYKMASPADLNKKSKDRRNLALRVGKIHIRPQMDAAPSSEQIL